MNMSGCNEQKNTSAGWQPSRNLWAAITEYDEERTLRETLEDGIEIGEARGLEIGRSEELRKTIRKLMTKIGLTMDQAMDFIEIPESEREKLKLEL